MSVQYSSSFGSIPLLTYFNRQHKPSWVILRVIAWMHIMFHGSTFKVMHMYPICEIIFYGNLARGIRFSYLFSIVCTRFCHGHIFFGKLYTCVPNNMATNFSTVWRLCTVYKELHIWNYTNILLLYLGMYYISIIMFKSIILFHQTKLC